MDESHGSPPLIVHEEGTIAWLTLNRPQRLNAIDAAMGGALRSYFQGLYMRRDIRVVVLQGAGRAFCAGLDLAPPATSSAAPAAPTQRREVGDLLDFQQGIRDVILAMRRCPQPIISVVQGAACGGGFALALASDLRLATPDARMNAAFVRIGLSGCDVGVSYFLPRMVGSSVAAEYLLTGRFLLAERAYQLGLVSRVDALPQLQAEARAMAEEMLDVTPLGLRLTKDALGHAVDAASLEAAIALEDRNQVLCCQGEDFDEGVAAFLEKRAPRYRSR